MLNPSTGWSDPTWAQLYTPRGGGHDPPQIAVDETIDPPPVNYLDQLQAYAQQGVPLDQVYLARLDG